MVGPFFSITYGNGMKTRGSCIGDEKEGREREKKKKKKSKRARDYVHTCTIFADDAKSNQASQSAVL